MDKVEEFAGMALVVDLGVENLRDFEFGFIINKDGWGWRLNSFGDQVQKGWFQHGEMEYGVYSTEPIWEPKGDGVGSRSCNDLVHF